MDSNNKTRQLEEVEALSSIYGEDWVTESEACYSIKVKDIKREILLSVTMTPDYPSQSPPQYELSAPWMDRKAKQILHQTLDAVYLDNIGETVIYQWVEAIRECLMNMKTPSPEPETELELPESIDRLKLSIECPAITHGAVLTDRKSNFQGHAAEVHSIEEVNAVLEKLKENKKIMNATHNMYAYRIERTKNGHTTFLQDCDDDGEAHAGGRMLHLLQILDQKNTLVVVSRWYGGIQLGPDRFRHINNATRQVIEQAGLLKKK
ncbi:protein IMPACT-like [Ostrinia furnacalis]|uniref:protein IMPACT-like n=1 Tax=Ostrinia furnacalis TaxID=93504 RepID=UPI00103E6337|nr:protein IMPACT-like [Ostrinia furnacalis]